MKIKKQPLLIIISPDFADAKSKRLQVIHWCGLEALCGFTQMGELGCI